MKRPARRLSAGFTLVEVVVSLGVLSLIMLATISALRTFGNTQGSVDRITTRVDEIRSVSGFLRDTLEAAVAPSGQGSRLSAGPGSNVRIPPYFKGGEESLEWKAPIMFGESYGGVFLVRVAREGDQLVLRWREPTGKEGEKGVDWSDTPRRTLLEDLGELEIAYRPEFDLPWQETWDEEGSPTLVRLGIQAGGRFWPELILRVQR